MHSCYLKSVPGTFIMSQQIFVPPGILNNIPQILTRENAFMTPQAITGNLLQKSVNLGPVALKRGKEREKPIGAEKGHK